MLKDTLKKIINQGLQIVDVRMVNANWGPRGPHTALQRIKRRGWSPQCIIDIGASNGIWTLETQQVYPYANYILIDPLPQNIQQLEALSKKHHNITYWSGALGAQKTSLPIHMHSDQSSMYTSKSFQAKQSQMVSVLPLDSFIEQNQYTWPNFIKMDVQGYELEVIRGATCALEQAELALLEVSYQSLYEGAPLAHEIICAMGRAGFRIYDIATYAQRPKDGELTQSDILFAKESTGLFSAETWS